MALPTNEARWTPNEIIVASGVTVSELETNNPSTNDATAAGSTAGTVTASLASTPGKAAKVVVVYFNGFEGNAATLTLPVTFAAGEVLAPAGYAGTALTVAGDVLTIPAQASPLTGIFQVIGQ